MPKKNRGKKKDDDWNDEETETKLEEKMKNLSTSDDGEVKEGKKSKKVY
jgi:hypothetical protein